MIDDLISRARFYDDRAAWLAARPGQDRTAIGASEVANILGHGFLTPFEFWACRQAGEPDQDIDGDLSGDPDPDEGLSPTDPRSRGNRWERVVIDEYNATQPGTMDAAGRCLGRTDALVTIRHASIPWITASPDAFVGLGSEMWGGECKTSVVPAAAWGPSQTIASAEDYSDSLLPPCYYTQCQWQAAAMDLPGVVLAVLLGSYRLRAYRIVRDDACIRQLIDVAGEWRERHLVRGEAPPIDGSDGARGWLSKRFAAIRGLERAATDAEADMLRTYAAERATEKAAAERKDELRNRIALAMGEHTKLYIPGAKAGASLSAGATRRLSLYGF